MREVEFVPDGEHAAGQIVLLIEVRLEFTSVTVLLLLSAIIPLTTDHPADPPSSWVPHVTAATTQSNWSASQEGTNPEDQRGHGGPRDCSSSERERSKRGGRGRRGRRREREARREARQRERERKRLILLQQQLQQQQQLVSEEGEGPSSDAEDEVLFREAMSEVPVVGSPVPEYEVEEEKEEEDEEEARIRKKKRLLPVALPPADKGILRSPSYRFVRCKELAQEASEAV
ncbi:uncharacterized protein LOC135099630 [Scylla paramamosain]|uniref:uncharacterized protein LOC135099630 n=1 Tax=Scylla paramamosain TaxID=85552 RepID=UPI0030831BC6